MQNDSIPETTEDQAVEDVAQAMWIAAGGTVRSWRAKEYWSPARRITLTEAAAAIDAARPHIIAEYVASLDEPVIFPPAESYPVTAVVESVEDGRFQGIAHTDDDEPVVLGEPLSRRSVRLKVTGRRELEPLVVADDFADQWPSVPDGWFLLWVVVSEEVDGIPTQYRACLWSDHDDGNVEGTGPTWHEAVQAASDATRKADAA